METSLLNLQMLLRKIGRGVVLYAHDGTEAQNPVRWDFDSPIQLAHLGDTEGEIVLNPNPTIATLTLPEISGGAVYEATATGENPVIDIPLYLADPDLLPIISPTGSASAGLERVQDVSERTIMLAPERLFKRLGLPGYGELGYTTASGWTLDGAPFTAAAQETLKALTVWLWRGYFNRPSRRFRGGHGDDAKNIEPVQFTTMMHPDAPDGHHLYTSGDPGDYGIDLDPLS